MSERSPPVRRLPIVGVMGSGSRPQRDRAEPLGAWLARRGVHLLTGGGPGVMASVSRAFYQVPDREGLVMGILRSGREPGTDADGYPNPWVELPVRTHLPLSGERGGEQGSRNHINVLTSDVVVALPGGAGTASEVALAVAYGRPVVAWAGAGPDDASLPAGVVRARDLDQVTDFVDRVLEGRAAPQDPHRHRGREAPGPSPT